MEWIDFSRNDFTGFFRVLVQHSAITAKGSMCCLGLKAVSYCKPVVT